MSEITPYQEIDHLEQARDRVTEQFKGKPVIDLYLQLLIEQQQDLEKVFKDLLQLRSIDTAFGEQLDVIGRIVGQPRELIGTNLLSYFAFVGWDNAETFGDLDNGSVGGFFFSLGTPLTGSTFLNDEQYRLFIKAKILKNTTLATPEQFLYFVSFVFGANVNNVLAESNAAFTIMVGKELNSFEKLLLLDYRSDQAGFEAAFPPKPVGVRVNFGQFDADNVFAFQGVPNAKGFGDRPSFSYNARITHNGVGYYGEDPNAKKVGGKFATLL